MRILVIEDVVDVGEALVARLTRLGHAVDWQVNGEDGAELLAHQAYDVVILDVTLPGRDGFSILKSYRAHGGTAAVLVLTARSQIDDRVSALDLGADDYMVKPFDFRELEARVRALMRRGQGAPTDILSVGDLKFDRAAREVRIGTAPVELTRREIAVLEVLMTRTGRTVSKETLIEQVFALDDEAGTNAIELYIGRIRKKLAGSRAAIRTLRGLGYQITADDAA
jgi:two-component system response regulator TctD